MPTQNNNAQTASQQYNFEDLAQQALTGGLSQANINEALGAYSRGYLQDKDLADYFNKFIPATETSVNNTTTNNTNNTTTGADVTAERTAGQEEVEGNTAYDDALKKLEDVYGRKDESVQKIVDAMKGLTETRQSAWDKLFGEESKISRFYAPAIQAVEEQLLDTEELITNLRGGLEERLETAKGGQGVTQSQFEHIYSKERTGLVDQFDKLTRSMTRLKAGLDTELLLSEKQFDMEMQGAQEQIDAMKFGLEQEGFDDAEISMIMADYENQMQEQMNRAQEDRQIAAEIRAEQRAMEKETREEETARKENVQSILQNAMDFVLQAGIIPTDKFQKVIDDANKMLEEGKTLSEIQLGVTRAIGDNPQVRNYINSLFQQSKGSSSGPSSSFSTTMLLKARANGEETGNPEIDALTYAQARSMLTVEDDEYNPFE